MASKARNDSTQMKDLLQFEECHTRVEDKREEDRQHGSRGSASQASWSSSASSSSASSSSTFSSASSPASRGQRDKSPRKAEGREGMPAWRKEEEEEEVEEEEEETMEGLSRCNLRDLRRIQDCGEVMGELSVTKKHTVLIDVSTFNGGVGIIPHEGADVWHSNYVKMPCSQAVSQNGFSQAPRWKVISQSLRALSKMTTAGVKDVEDTILQYNPKYKGQWSFDALAAFIKRVPKPENYIPTLLPKIAKLALRLPEDIKTRIPLLQTGQTAAITLSQVQISVLLANAFFCTFPHRNTSRPNAEYHNYPSINFSSLFGGKSERKNQKLRAIMHYFNVVTDERTKLDGLVTFERRCLKGADIPEWRSSTEKINRLYVTSRGNIEDDGIGLLQVDFACSLIGGGVLGSGLVQEEILFLINPELIVSRLFTERLAETECLIIAGSQQFSCYIGYSDNFEWMGPHTEQLKRGEWARWQRQILAIDALNYRNRSEQYSMFKIKRELNKAYCGFKGRPKHKEPDIATGKWGCGAFNGDAQLKAVIQLMAAAKAGRGLAFFTFEDEQLKRKLEKTHHLLVTEGITVGKLYSLLEHYCAELRKRAGPHIELFDFLRKTLRRNRSQL